ncbi:hypothetical protein [Faecalibaculum rodentium]|uniref:hypothetical protein n=1 Tax=Faecalibaculum rodentium TaxID=1702221 RepID=UPI00256EB56B|nr:hypothetical protein [Faecalibaculum rodentium]
MESRIAQLNTAGELTADAAVTDMEEYTRLLLQKEKLQKECVQLDMEFDELFGPLILEEFQAQIELVRQKIELSLYIKAMNQGQDPDPEEIEKAVAQRTANWQKQLEEMAEYPESLKCRSIVPPEEMRQISRLYRKMVKMIHPDLHPELEHDPRIRELWDRLQTAYRLNALDEMEEIAVLIHQVLADSDTAPVQITDLTEKIEKLRQELHTITTTDPWLYSTWIYDTVKIEKRRGEYQDSIQSWNEARTRLAAKLETLLLEWKGSACPMN